MFTLLLRKDAEIRAYQKKGTRKVDHAERTARIEANNAEKFLLESISPTLLDGLTVRPHQSALASPLIHLLMNEVLTRGQSGGNADDDYQQQIMSQADGTFHSQGLVMVDDGDQRAKKHVAPPSSAQELGLGFDIVDSMLPQHHHATAVARPTTSSDSGPLSASPNLFQPSPQPSPVPQKKKLKINRKNAFK
jgi:hypothetical protein